MNLTPTWLNIAPFWVPKPTKIPSWRRLEASWARLEGLLGRLGRVLERLGLILERLGGVLERLGRVLKRLGAENASWKLSAIIRAPRAQLCLGLVSPQHLMKKVTFGKTTYRETTEDLCRDRVPLNADTQLGAFGPGADPTRSRAAYPPPRLAVNLFVFCCWHLGSLD